MNDSIGTLLRQERETRSISLDQVAAATKIRMRYLEAIENGDFESLPSPAQARGFVRAYAGYLKLDPQAVLDTPPGQEPSAEPVQAPPLPIPEPRTVTHDQAIFGVVGEKFRTQRQNLGLSLDDVERHTHLRQHYLQMIENGEFESLPSPVQARGMLKNYAAFLGLDPEPLLLRYADGLQAGLADRHAAVAPRRSRPAARQPIGRRPLWQRLLSPDLLVSSLVVVFLVGFVSWGIYQISSIRALSASQTPTPTSPSVLDVLLGTEPPVFAATATLSSDVISPTLGLDLTAEGEGTSPANLEIQTAAAPELDALTPSPTTALAPPPSTSAVQVFVVVQQRTWMRVVVDNEVAFEGRVQPGSAYPFAGDERIEVLTGNGAALQLFYNELDLGLMGTFGEVVNRIYSSTGMQTPTPTVTPTGMPAPTTTPTPTGEPGATPLPTP